MSFKDLPSIDMTAPEIFAANQKANAPIPIRRGAKTPNPNATATP